MGTRTRVQAGPGGLRRLVRSPIERKNYAISYGLTYTARVLFFASNPRSRVAAPKLMATPSPELAQLVEPLAKAALSRCRLIWSAA